ncbi:hypothetical protein GCM10018793_34700 [Streptomyces sulfonofaciens]|uniref:Flp pilus assembly protein RcpC/CpaB domain-containing protein n=1 Tax=Streptomyces sulfonofaciens TaxID=68272 RepID=A0A919L0D1_9ACTN|nr:hypothetical protein [Streptomyces sulfonofaciens]GHH80185.1 hypothetical protein GCM10018793_34700 [Streptomyces sulfonofaciens]
MRVREGHPRLRRLIRHRRRAVAAGLAMTAAALVAAGAADTGRARAQAEGRTAAPHRASPAPELVTAPVRIADAAAVRLLHPGDHVDVIAADAPGAGGTGQPQVVAEGARVVELPRTDTGSAVDGALVVLSVPRPTAARLAGAGARSRLAVTLC